MTILIPAYDNGQLQPIEKMLVHKKGLKHLAISIFIIADGKVLLQRRAFSKYHTPGLWTNTCCTHPYWNENTNTSALRRLEEELGMKNINLTKRNTVEYRSEVPPDLIEHEVVDIFVGKCKSNHPIEINPNEVLEIKWLSLRQIKEDIKQYPETYTAWIKIYMKLHAADIFKDTDFL
ncbi:isopentenyl-diphosphate delta-isomerase [Amylibacter sp.]|nr:isopentenyl-diphosphate delta-isomerase [Amylibacter sp.]MDB4208435.1 isopentenyl-diphosphate delta-isomerase [Amylibacter sp.]MDC1211630.1 isopentenyl-diphosphate delta-isomerase [Amylibacter sp.]MDC1376624.1 isopentenyl-diphosphate delta-isomerase [Amylibacter sp.]|tara:strand:- start:780 stop:1310 length:531 start_codon:yes stop_codon:yes gene_type:complete